MYEVRNHEAILGMMYGSPKTPDAKPVDTAVGLEVHPPFNQAERQVIGNWMENNSKFQLQYFVRMRDDVDASRYGVIAPFEQTADTKRHVRALADAIRMALESVGRELDITEEVYN